MLASGHKTWHMVTAFTSGKMGIDTKESGTDH